MAEDFECMPTSPSESIDLEKFRKLVRSYIERHHYKAAVFWADKVVSLSNGSPADVYWLAQSYYLTKQYHRAILLINSHKLTRNATCRYLVALCYYEVGEYHSALDILERSENNNVSRIKAEGEAIAVPEIDDTMSIECSTHLLKGYIYEASDNRALAVESFRAAVQADPLCYEAIHALTQHHMLTVKEEKELLSSLPLSRTCSEAESAVVIAVYETRTNKYSSPTTPLPQPAAPLATNADFITAQAEKLYYNCNFAQCHRLTQEVLKKDPYHTECLPIHVSCLVELKQSNSLFLLAHKLVDLYPESALSWFAVGCYYYLIGKNEQARRYLSKATALDRVFGPAWIAYGHSFAAENEHDQAMAAYFKAAQLMKGCHLPLLYIGMEYGLTNNPKFAEKFFKEALDIAPEDPFVLHELGVVSFCNQDYISAELYLRRAVALVEDSGVVVVPEKWATLLNNLAHTCRKLHKYEEALHFHQQALKLCPGVSSTYSALGLVQSLLGDYEAAVVSLHKALSLHRDDTTATTLLTTVMDQLMTQTPAFQGDDNIPQLDPPSDIVGTDTNASDITSDITPASADDPLSDSNLLGSSIGQPVMHSSDVGRDSLSQSLGQSTALLIEDMVMDDQSP
ncbi:cell division cycle protein 16 homolog [Penaeus japonicus]|uniref:cell division cycle protein 16 homolog n=1 Tax=Penaeus japonicus TaxID=27405 RepID=UPI001C71070C|nr:cell division cycle protein 16 homolog [Penaeus japonicus]